MSYRVMGDCYREGLVPRVPSRCVRDAGRTTGRGVVPALEIIACRPADAVDRQVGEKLDIVIFKGRDLATTIPKNRGGRRIEASEQFPTYRRTTVGGGVLTA
jgi:hypothetical protein